MDGLFNDESEDESLQYRDRPLPPPKGIPDYRVSLAVELNPTLTTTQKDRDGNETTIILHGQKAYQRLMDLNPYYWCVPVRSKGKPRPAPRARHEVKSELQFSFKFQNSCETLEGNIELPF
jgi:hypothetical protein